MHRPVGDVDHGFGAGQGAVAREGALLVVKLTLLPLIQLPHGVVPHGSPLLLGSGSCCLVVGRGRYAADALRPGLAVSREGSVAFRVAGHDWGSVAWHVSWQRLVRDYSEIKEQLQHETEGELPFR